jgi:hypothetical protein
MHRFDNLLSAIVLRRHVFTRFMVEKLRSAPADETRSGNADFTSVSLCNTVSVVEFSTSHPNMSLATTVCESSLSVTDICFDSKQMSVTDSQCHCRNI